MSLLGSLLKPQCLPATSIAARSVSVCTTTTTTTPNRAHHEARTHRRPCRDDSGGRAAVAGKTTASSIEDFFIASLVAAGTCREHREAVKSDAIARKRSNALRAGSATNTRAQQVRHFSSRPSRWQTAVAATPALPDPPNISQEEYRELVNTYPTFPKRSLSKWKLAEKAEEKERAEKHFPLAPRLVLTPEQEIFTGREHREPLPPEDEDHARQLNAFANLLQRRHWGTIPHAQLWKLFDDLRPPRLRHLGDSAVKMMFRHLSWKEYRPSQDSMHRYLDLISEATGEGIRLSSGIWNTAISDAGTWVRKATSTQVKAAIELWMRMEASGTRATHVTLNILFMVAVKASRYALADTIYKELVARDMPLNRYFRASVIYYAGMRHDGEGVRRAFREFVNAGEIVDTTIMNSVILGLVRSGEAPAAENVFLRMKKLHEDKFGTVLPEDWRTRKELARVLDKTGLQLRKDQQQHESSFFGAAFSSDDKREQVQQATPIAPDSTTYRILIKYHAYVSGNIDKLRELLAEMQGRGLHVHGSVYVHLLRGFHTHGGWARSQWSPASLEELWKEILTTLTPPPMPAITVDPYRPESIEEDATDMLGAMLAEQATSSAKDTAQPEHQPDVALPQSELERPTYFTKAMALAAIHAYYKCTNPSRTLEIWDDIRERWHDVSDQDYAAVQDRVDGLVAEPRRRR